MPQFDFYCFATQAFWVLFTFYVLYFFVLYFFVVKYSELFKFREKLVSIHKKSPKYHVSLYDIYLKKILESFK